MAATRAWRAFVVLAAGLVLVTAGCDSRSGNEATPTKEPVKLFVPCDGISDDAVRAAGADPATEEKDIAGVHQTDLEICAWEAPGYYVNVYSWPKSFEELRKDSRYTEFEDRSIAGRPVLEFREVSDSRRERCDMAFGAEQGSVSVNVQQTELEKMPEDPCVAAERAAAALASEIPK